MAHQDDSPSTDTASAAEVTSAVREKRLAAREFFDKWQQQCTQLEERLVGQLEGMASRLARVDQQDSSSATQEEIATQLLRLEELRDELSTKQEQWSAMQLQSSESQQEVFAQIKEQFARLDRQQADLETRRAELEQQALEEDTALEEQLTHFQEELIRLREQTAQRTGQAEQLSHELQQARAQLTAKEEELNNATRQLEAIASGNNQTTAEAARMAAELAETREEASSQVAAAQIALSQARADQERLREELSASRQQLEESQLRLEELQEKAIAEKDDAHFEPNAELEELRRECQLLQDELAQAAKTTHDSEGIHDSQELAKIKKQFEHAQAELRELKARNERLEAQVQTTDKTTANANDGLDWESQKRRMLAQLEEEDLEDEESTERRLSIESALRITDQVVSEKEEEILELRRLLDNQSSNIAGVAIGAQAIADMLDDDELIQQEREKLETIQAEWREKLRKAEIDISVERAKIARERAQLEEQLRDLEDHRGKISSESATNETEDDKPKKGRWLSRLGLKDGEEG